MTKRDRKALRKSIAAGVRAAVFDTLFPPVGDYAADVWCSDRKTWEGPEVGEECRKAWTIVVEHLIRLPEEMEREEK